MNKKIIIILLSILITFHIISQEMITDVEKITFEGVNISESVYKSEAVEMDYKFNIAYSPFLPYGGIYIITDDTTGKEAIIQIGLLKVDRQPYRIYISDNLFQFFSKTYVDKTNKINLKLKFIGWNTKGEESDNLNIHNFIVKPDDAYNKISKNGLDQYYIQIGAFNYYQNSYPVLVDLIQMLQIIPEIYMVEKELTKGIEHNKFYRVLAGPYSLASARKIATKINDSKKATVFIHSGESILSESNEVKIGENK